MLGGKTRVRWEGEKARKSEARRGKGGKEGKDGRTRGWFVAADVEQAGIGNRQPRFFPSACGR
jgi:hypothetical protein